MMGHFLTLLSNPRARRFALPAGILSSALGAAVACGSSDQPQNTGVLPQREKPTTQTVTVTVAFPNDTVKGTTNSLHVWFIEKDDSGANCADLVGGATDPNAGPLGHLGDVVTQSMDGPITAKDVTIAKTTLVYVEAVDDNGQVDWAGCYEITNNTSSKASATVTLDKARVYDCTKPDVKNGAPCDDGDPCTVGESCRDGECKNSKQRDCKALDDDCNVGTCDPVDGCIKVAYNDGALCSDGLDCTTGDKCTSGKCIGTAKDCTTDSGGCSTGSTCVEPGGYCTSGIIQPYGTPCNDGKRCTTNDQCDFSGNCTGTTMDCSTTGGGCAQCSETTGTCSDPKPAGTSCSFASNSCISGGSCNGSGACVGQPRDCTSYNSGNGCTVGICDSSFGCTSTYVLSGTVCDDGNPCTTGDHCDGSGICTYSGIGTTCDDGNPCTTGDTCSGTYCTYTSYAPSTTPCGAPCATGTCSGSGYCNTTTYLSNGCDDGNPCTVNDSCSFGSCYSGSYAPAGTPCTLAGCPNGAVCMSGGNCGCK